MLSFVLHFKIWSRLVAVAAAASASGAGASSPEAREHFCELCPTQLQSAKL